MLEQMVVASISGIRGIVNQDLLLPDLGGYVEGFAASVPGRVFLVGRDTRRSGESLRRVVCGVLVGAGARVVDYGVISTPALFRESRLRNSPAVMVTASHNEPEWNGLKFIVNGRGITQTELDQVVKPRRRGATSPGSISSQSRPSYNAELIEMVGGKGSGEGVSVGLDLNGGAAIPHAPPILQGLGCRVKVLGGSPGIFNRLIDPTADGLELLRRLVREEGLDLGLAFDCDGDRLVLVDDQGVKRSGDFMLTLAVKKLLPGLERRAVVVSVDTTRAIDDVVSELGGKVYRSMVGEANVVSLMTKENVTLGGEGSSGGMIDGSYNYCRDSMVAAAVIVKAVKKGGRRTFDEVPSYEQSRLKVVMPRRKALAAMKRLQKQHAEADLLDGIKLETSSRSWVLIRVSGTEDAIRVSAESTSSSDARELAESYLKELEGLV